MPGPGYLDGDTVTLRTIEREDLEFCQRNINDPRVRRGTGFPGPATADEEEQWYEDVVCGDGVHLLICVDGDPVGVIGIEEAELRPDIVELGYWIAPDAQGNGYATDAVRTAVDHALRERPYHRVSAEVAAFNDASKRVLEKAGFRHEGTRRDAWYDDGGYVDLEEYGLLEDEWGE